MKTTLTILAFIILLTCCKKDSSNKQVHTRINDSAQITNIDTGDLFENFDSFYKRFHQDSTFQLSRVKFPIKGAYKDFDTTITWTALNWGFLKFSVDQIDTSEYNIVFEKKDKIVIEQVNCKDCGFSFEIKFEMIGDKWYVTHRQDNNY